MKGHLIYVDNVSKCFPMYGLRFLTSVKTLKVLENVSFPIYEGETLALAGESGCGKTTLGKIITGIVKPTYGRVLYRSKDILTLKGEEYKKFRRAVQMVFQDPKSSLNPKMKVNKILSEPIKIRNIKDNRKISSEIKNILEKVNLGEDSLDKYPYQLSGGEAQKVAIARTLLVEPELIVLDEPLSALDLLTQLELIRLLKELQEDYRLTYFLITHNINLTKCLSHRVITMYLGNIMEAGETRSVLEQPKHPYTKFLVSANLDIKAEKKKTEIPLLEENKQKSSKNKGCVFATRCIFSSNICRERKPQLIDIGKDHYVACHFI
ncbi:MAG: oligopeptide/dipeptide ABC transporter ATP-binding protein [Candidatus Odinarchaeia archaeon]